MDKLDVQVVVVAGEHIQSEAGTGPLARFPSDRIGLDSRSITV